MALNVAQVRNLKEPGRYADGGGLYLYIQSTGSKSWVARLGTRAKRWDIGLGSVRDVSLAEARKDAALLRKFYKAGIDPLQARGHVMEHRKARNIEELRLAGLLTQGGQHG